MTADPRVTVLMAVHNGLPYLQEAVDSILGQTFGNFEFLIVDDGSTDGGLDFLQSYADKRIRVISNPKRLELSRSLNLGMDAALGEYIARMDDDDISHTSRLADQVRFLDANPKIDVLGTGAKTLGETRQIWSYPKSDEDIRSEFIFNSALVHSSVMMRRSTFERHKLRYDPEYKRSQDFELWTRAAPDLRFANLGSHLVRYRIHPKQIGHEQADEQQAAASAVRERGLGFLGVKPSQDQIELHNNVSKWDFSAPGVELGLVELWFSELDRANRASRHLPISAFGRALERRWWAVCRTNVKIGLEAWRTYTRSPLSKFGSRSALSRARFYGKALLREQRRNLL
jgi:glycosyltransferase involved in cell wall biosynthesis